MRLLVFSSSVPLIVCSVGCLSVHLINSDITQVGGGWLWTWMTLCDSHPLWVCGCRVSWLDRRRCHIVPTHHTVPGCTRAVSYCTYLNPILYHCCIQTKQRYIAITPCCRHHSDSKGPISISWTLLVISILCKYFAFCTNTMHNTMQNATDQSAYLARSLWSAFGAGPNHNATHLGLGAVLMSIFCYKLYNESQLPTLIC